jgi:hypothetical protein
MRPAGTLTLFAFSLLSLSPAVLAQNYSGSVGDLNTIFDPPMNINGTLCDVNVNTGNEHAYKACSDGVSAARWMAEKYAKNTGKYLGCLDGFYQGISDGYNAGINPSQDMIKQADAYVKGASFDSATSRGLVRAKAEGQTESADQIIARYRSVVGLKDAQGRQVLPNKDYNFPKVSFNGFEDGYEYDIVKQIGNDFDAVYNKGWVTKDSRFEDRLAARKALALQNEFASSLCNQTDTIFGRRSMPSISIWDFFRANRQYNFQNYGWRNPDWAWEIFDRDERTLEQYQTFSRLKTLEKTVTETIAIKENRYKLDANGAPIRKLDANGAPAVDAQGKPLFEMEEVITGYRNETKRVKLSDAEVQALANIYINGFKQAYDRFYARQYASINYNQEGIEKYKVAKVVGKTMGEEVANHIARREAYNNQYKLQSAKKYAEEVKRLYKESFDRLMGIFENNPVVELNEAEVIGQVQDAIFRPGEELKIQMTVTNLGEKEAPSTINFESTSDVQATVSGFSFVAPVLTRSNFVTTTLGRISEQREARSAVNVGMSIRNQGDLGDVARSLIVRKQKTISLNDYVEIDGVNGNLDFLAGSLSILVNVKNPAKNVESPISIVEASLGNLGFADKNIEPIAPGASRQAMVNLENMDPLALIISGTISGSVNVRLGNKIAHRQPISYALPLNRVDALTTYHDALATKKANNTGREGKADRLAKLQGMLEELVKADIEKNVLWKKGEEVQGTIVAVIQRIYDESKRAGRINDEAQKIYDDLGKVLARNAKDVRNGGGIRLVKPNRENFLKEISKFAKISTKVKDWTK